VGAGRSEFVVSTMLHLIGGGGIVLLLLLGQMGLQALLDAIHARQSLAALAPWAIAIACVAGIQSFITAVQRERQQILGDLLQRHVEEHVLEVAAAVDPLGFETPAFHNRVQRMQLSRPQSLNLVFDLSSLIRSAIGVVAVLATLITIQRTPGTHGVDRLFFQRGSWLRDAVRHSGASLAQDAARPRTAVPCSPAIRSE
jgi:ATP-binding cassette, subfamily B, bacterial